MSVGRLAVGAAGGDHDAVDALAEQLLDVALLALRIVGGVAHEDRDALVGEALLEPFHDRHGEAAEGVGGDHADGEALAAVQAWARSLGRKPSLQRSVAHLLARLLAQPPLALSALRPCRSIRRPPRDVADGRARRARTSGRRPPRAGGGVIELT